MPEIALTCYRCNATYELVRTDFSSRGVIVRDVEGYRCPVCKEEIFTSDQADVIEKRIYALAPRVPSSERTISSAAGKKPMMYLPEKALDAVGLHIGDKVSVSVQGKSIILTPT